jgi:hypothetical protein
LPGRVSNRSPFRFGRLDFGVTPDQDAAIFYRSKQVESVLF